MTGLAILQQSLGPRHLLNGARQSTGCLGLGRLRWQPGMVVIAFVRHNEHRRVIYAPLNMLPRRAAPDAAAFVVTPWMRGTLDWFLSILPP